MEELIITLLSEIPTTGILVLFVWIVRGHFQEALNLLSKHLEGLNQLIMECIATKEYEGRILRNRERILNLERLLEDMAGERELLSRVEKEKKELEESKKSNKSN